MMTKHSSSTTLRAFIYFFILVRSCSPRNPFSDVALSTLNPTSTGFTIMGNAAGDSFGYSSSTAGDINKDGYDDIIVGAPWKNNNQGAAYVIYGGEESAFLNVDLGTTPLNPLTTGFMITGEAASGYFGKKLSTAGDIDNDGYDDIIIAAEGKNGNQGAVYVIYGGPKSTMSNIVLSSTPFNPLITGFMITGNAVDDNFGVSVSAAGDIDNDGYDDIIIGANQKNNYQGAAYVIYGGEKSTMSNIVLSSTALTPTSTGFMITAAARDNLGYPVSAAGDIDNDGFDDIIVGAYFKNSNRGAAYVIYGGPKATRSNILLSSTPLIPTSTGFMITGNANGDILGASVSTAGDVDNDGFDDIIVGAQNKNGNQGAAYVIYGGPKATRSDIALASTPLVPTSTGFMITGNAAGDLFGNIVRAAGDLNNDGFDDIIINAPNKNNDEGVVYVIFGGTKATRSHITLSSTTLNPTSTGFMIEGSDHFGQSISTAGDINNDGNVDIIIGADRANNHRGVASVIYANCPPTCKQCRSETVCTECKGSYHLYQSGCLASCPITTLETPTTCEEDCPDYCNKCSSTSECTECQSSYHMYKSECFDPCPDTTFANTPTTCEDCLTTHCKHCSSPSVCIECQDSDILYQSGCLDSCPDGMFLSSTNTCEDCPTHCNHCNTASVCTECVSSFVLYESECFASCPKTMFNDNNECKDCPAYCSSCTSEDSCQVCIKGYTLSNSNSLCVLSSDSSQQKATQAISSTTQGIGSVLCVGSSIIPFSAMVSKIVQSTRYLNLSVTDELTEVYATWNTDLISWNVPNLMSNLDHFETSPILFAQYDLGSPFLVNFWPTLINVVIGFGAFIVCILVRRLCERAKYEGWAYSLVQKFVAGSFNFALIQAYACLDDILFYLVVDAKTNPFNSFFSWASMICAVIFLAMGCLQVFLNFWTVRKYQSIKSQKMKDLIEAFNERNKYWELFYSDFTDNDLWGQSFFALAIIRSSLSSFIIAIFYDYPLMQTSYLIMVDLAIISFLSFKNPFNSLRGTLAQYYYEIITLLVHFCAFILSLQDTFEKSSETVRFIMSTGILYLNTALISGVIGFMFIEIYKNISEKKLPPKISSQQVKTIVLRLRPK